MLGGDSLSPFASTTSLRVVGCCYHAFWGYLASAWPAPPPPGRDLPRSLFTTTRVFSLLSPGKHPSTSGVPRLGLACPYHHFRRGPGCLPPPLCSSCLDLEDTPLQLGTPRPGLACPLHHLGSVLLRLPSTLERALSGASLGPRPRPSPLNPRT